LASKLGAVRLRMRDGMSLDREMTSLKLMTPVSRCSQVSALMKQELLLGCTAKPAGTGKEVGKHEEEAVRPRAVRGIASDAKAAPGNDRVETSSSTPADWPGP